jgi:dTDP-glucose 4,6-dehydratase
MIFSNNMKLLCTGGCGFVGSHVVEHFLKNTDWEIIVIDKLNYASNGFDRLRDINCFDDKRVKIFPIDLQEPISIGVKQEIGEVDYILNLASESHVDNSIKDPVNFILNNVKLTLNILEYAREVKPKKFIQFSTDEVMGPAPEDVKYKEGDRHNPTNPYSASKSAQEAICSAYANTYGLPIVVTNGMNFIGERQHKEKFVPICIRKILTGETIQIHSNSDRTKAGSRFYIHCRNAAKALQFILENTNETLDKLDASKGRFNIVGEKETDNLTFARMIAGIVGKELKYELVDFHGSRPGHDLRYALDGNKLKKQGFKYPLKLEESLKKTVLWYLKEENQRWLI